jgi:hypothetical protein
MVLIGLNGRRRRRRSYNLGGDVALSLWLRGIEEEESAYEKRVNEKRREWRGRSSVNILVN